MLQSSQMSKVIVSSFYCFRHLNSILRTRGDKPTEIDYKLPVIFSLINLKKSGIVAQRGEIKKIPSPIKCNIRHVIPRINRNIFDDCPALLIWAKLSTEDAQLMF